MLSRTSMLIMRISMLFNEIERLFNSLILYAIDFIGICSRVDLIVRH